MQLHELKSITNKGKRRLGQGHGSGRVKTSGRGTKGQKARGKIALSFEGGALALIKRMPFHRGKGRNNPLRPNSLVVNVSALNKLPKDTVVDLESLIKHNIVSSQEAKRYGVKVLGDGVIDIALNVKLPVSKTAEEKIVKAGGKVEPVNTVAKSA